MNNKKMNQMRESIKKQNFAYVGIILLSAALYFVSQRPTITASMQHLIMLISCRDL
jgi:hypothetical protein